jgi:hypothetical protein
LFEFNGKLSNETTVKDISFKDIISTERINYKGTDCIEIKYKYSTLLGSQQTSLYLPGFDNPDESIKEINKAISALNLYEEQQALLKKEIEEREIQYEAEALEFYTDCYNYHIKENTPKYELFSEKNKIVLIYFDSEKNMTFLEIDGYKKEENVGIIYHEKIHYYEKAGNIHYVSDIKGSYSSFGGSFTGASFSKVAAAVSGLVFGVAGMAAAAMLTYKKAEQKPTETHFDLNSDIQRIDERNVLLNFYSDEKQQYIDIELPQDIYNFLQTYIPEKKYDIVNELEKHSVIQNNTSPQKLESGNIPEKLTEKSDISMDDFKQKVEKLKILREAGILSDEEFKDEKAKLMMLI